MNKDELKKKLNDTYEELPEDVRLEDVETSKKNIRGNYYKYTGLTAAGLGLAGAGAAEGLRREFDKRIAGGRTHLAEELRKNKVNLKRARNSGLALAGVGGAMLGLHAYEKHKDKKKREKEGKNDDNSKN